MSNSVGDETIRNVNLVSVTDPLLGQVVEQYKVESLIGSGAMGIVYRGVHQVIGKAVAIKVLKADFADDPDMVQRLIREARTVNAIRHPAIVDIFGFGTLPRTDQPYIVMDLLEGVPLDEYLKTRAPMTMKEIAPFLDELLSALAAAHAVGVIHRDLKPGNVFVESKPEGKKGIKVIDFGLAKQADRAGGSVRPTNPGTLLGTPAFMAPEQVMGTKVTPATDLYAVGGIAYQLLTNRLPHEAPSAIEVLTQKMQHEAVRAKQWQPSLDDEADAWVMQLLAKEPEKRIQDAEEARRQLRRVVQGRTSSSGSGLRASPRAPAPAPAPSKREWGDAKTVLTESSGTDPSPLPPSNTTAQINSPFAKTTVDLPPQVPVSSPTPAPKRSTGSSPPHTSSPSKPPSSRGSDLRRVESIPPSAEPELEATTLPEKLVPVKVVEQALQSAVRPPPSAPPEPSRVPLIIALATTILALLVALAFLFSRPA